MSEALTFIKYIKSMRNNPDKCTKNTRILIVYFGRKKEAYNLWLDLLSKEPLRMSMWLIGRDRQ